MDRRRDGRRERVEEWVGGGRGRVYEAYEVKNKRQKLRCLLLRRKKKNIFYLFMKSLLWKKFLNGAEYTTEVMLVLGLLLLVLGRLLLV